MSSPEEQNKSFLFDSQLIVAHHEYLMEAIEVRGYDVAKEWKNILKAPMDMPSLDKLHQVNVSYSRAYYDYFSGLLQERGDTEWLQKAPSEARAQLVLPMLVSHTFTRVEQLNRALTHKPLASRLAASALNHIAPSRGAEPRVPVMSPTRDIIVNQWRRIIDDVQAQDPELSQNQHIMLALATNLTKQMSLEHSVLEDAHRRRFSE